jgi:hypothetical protein
MYQHSIFLPLLLLLRGLHLVAMIVHHNHYHGKFAFYARQIIIL